MRPSADVVIIGGGIQGCSIVFHLVKRGMKNVSLIEARRLGEGSSGATAAMLMHQTGNLLTTRLAQISILEYLSYPDEANIGFHKIGSICFVTKASPKVAELRQWVRMQKDIGLSSRELSNNDISKHAPMLETRDIELASYCPEDGYIDPYSVIHWYAQIARSEGAEINLEVEATGIEKRGAAIVGVNTTAGFIKTPCVVNAAGVWARKIGKWVGIDLPIKNYIRNIVLLAPRPPLEEFPIIEDVVTEWYLRPEGRNIMVGVGPQIDAPDIPDLLQPAFCESCLKELAEYMDHRTPKLIDVGVTRMRWAGIRCTTPDQLPILGPASGIPGFLNCCGWSGFGVTLAPFTGRLLAGYIVDGRAPGEEAARFLLDRFSTTKASSDGKW